jgi:hypothetical protein
MKKMLALLSLVILIQGCVSPDERRETFYKANPHYEYRGNVLIGDAVAGMSMDAVRASLGDPQETSSRNDDGTETEVWQYYNSGEQMNLQILAGDSARVEHTYYTFVDGILTHWSKY